MLIALSGKARSGKSTAARILVEEYGFTAVAFADPLRELAYAVNPDYADAVDTLGYELAKDTLPWVRDYLCVLGQGVRQHLYSHAWIDALEDRMPDGDVVIQDTRYYNEAMWVKTMGGFVVRITRDHNTSSTHESETELDTWVADYRISNDADLEALAEKIDQIVESVERREYDRTTTRQ